MPRPAPSDHASYYAKYVALVPEDDPLPALRSGGAAMLALLRDLPDSEALVRHPPYTWSLKQVVGHLIDCERIFAYRALRVARGDATPLPGFEENEYVGSAEFDARPLADLASEYDAVRRSTLALFDGLPAAAWDRRGVANGSEVSVRALAFILAGHERHHAAIVRKRLGRGE